MPGMGVGNLSTMGAGALGMGIPGLGNVTGVTSVGGNIQTGDALTQAYSGIQQYNGKLLICNKINFIYCCCYCKQ